MGIPSSFAQRGLTRKIRFIVGMSDWNLSRNDFVRLSPHAAIISIQCPKGDNSSERESLPSFLLPPNAKKKRRRKQSGNRKARTTFSYIPPPPQRGELGVNGAIYDADILRFYLPYEYCLPERGKRAAVFDGKRDKPIRGRYSPSRCLLPRL